MNIQRFPAQTTVLFAMQSYEKKQKPQTPFHKNFHLHTTHHKYHRPEPTQKHHKIDAKRRQAKN
ncbi:MAG: hypothetical protein J6X62_03540 [Bacteroidales bacterium]|nr:hypothetical protein [Bacteroidales bacterium]